MLAFASVQFLSQSYLSNMKLSNEEFIAKIKDCYDFAVRILVAFLACNQNEIFL